MKTNPLTDVSAEKSIARELAKRRAFIVLFIVSIEIVGAFIGLEGDMLAHALDDYAILAISVVALVVIGAMWKKQSLAGLRKQHNIARPPYRRISVPDLRVCRRGQRLYRSWE